MLVRWVDDVSDRVLISRRASIDSERLGGQPKNGHIARNQHVIGLCLAELCRNKTSRPQDPRALQVTKAQGFASVKRH